MSALLGLDIGRRRTGVALGDTVSGFVVALDVIRHKTDDELLIEVKKLLSAKKISEVFIGLPRLPQGDEGEQAEHARSIGQRIEKDTKLKVTFIDERYSSLGGAPGTNADAKAACEILSVALDQRKNDY